MVKRKRGFLKFLPREEQFFTLFVNQVKLIVEASRLLLEAVRAGNSHMARASEEIRTLEAKGDEIIHHTFTLLNQTFITPLDPEDIHALSSSLDDVLDGIEDAAHRIFAYRLNAIPPAMAQLCALIYDCAESLQKCFQALNDKGQVAEYCIEINRLEDVADGGWCGGRFPGTVRSRKGSDLALMEAEGGLRISGSHHGPLRGRGRCALQGVVIEEQLR